LSTPVAAKPNGLTAQAPRQLLGLHHEVNALPSMPGGLELYGADRFRPLAWTRDVGRLRQRRVKFVSIERGRTSSAKSTFAAAKILTVSIRRQLPHARPLLPLINDSDSTVRRMDIDAPRPRCPFCGLPLRFRFSALSTLQTFDCNGCQVVLNIPPQAGALEIAAPAVAHD